MQSMKIYEVLQKKRTLSFEVFPPKRTEEGTEKIFATIDALKELNPDYISVTYGASGSNARNAAEIAGYIKRIGIEPLAHLTGGPSSPEDIDRTANEFLSLGVENVLALRGDKPVDCNVEYCKYFPHATDLMEYLQKYPFSLAGAAYPEGHFECDTLFKDLEALKIKQDAGAKFFVTQLFYDNSYYYRLVREAEKLGITVPIIPGIMPLLKVNNIKRVKEMCGSAVPLAFRNMIEVYSDRPAVMEEIGLNFAVYQIIDLLANGAPGIHLYIMNNAAAAQNIYSRLERVFRELF